MKEVAWVPGFAAANDFLDSTGYAGQIDAELVALLREGAALPLLTTSRADVFRARMWDALVEWFAPRDLLICPTLCVEPFEVGRFAPAFLDGEPLRRRILGWCSRIPST
jgi:aspartyl-tRNA(Asn)/glutamyl-tRNA(Gln) amidotransferase subunit A